MCIIIFQKLLFLINNVYMCIIIFQKLLFLINNVYMCIIIFQKLLIEVYYHLLHKNEYFCNYNQFELD